MDKKLEENPKEEKIQRDKNQPLIHDFDKKDLKSSFTPKIIALLGLVVVFGILTGFFMAGKNPSSLTAKNSNATIDNTALTKGTVVGSTDTSTFKDTAEGIVKEGGIDGEGAFHLERPGGDSQNVYMTSSIVDLSKFINKKIKVWGQTQQAQHAGWLMDVGKVEIL